jgi:omega-amidase
MNTLNISLVQSNLYWESPEKNIQHFENIIKALPASSDLVILPEMFTTGFSMRTSELAEDYDGKTINWMVKTASYHNKTIVGSIIYKKEKGFTNRLFWIRPNGQIFFYDKRHLFRMGNEHEFFLQGENQFIIYQGNWRIMPLICYDLRFPVWSRNRNNYDLLIYIANWPEPRREVWKTLLKARAIENQAFVVGVNRIGSDGMNINYSGDSMVVDYKGNIISNIEPYKESATTYNLNLEELQDFRTKFPAHLDADEFEII